MQNHNNDKGLKLELDTSTDVAAEDMAFDDVGVDEELDDSMNAALPQQSKSRGKAKLMAGVVLLAVLGIGGYVGYKNMSTGGNAAPVAAIPSDVATPLAGMNDPMAAQPLPGSDGMMPPAADGTMPIDPALDPMMAGNMPPADGSVMPPMDGGVPIDPALDMGGTVPPVAPGMPDAVTADVNAPVDPMMVGNMPPMDGSVSAADPMAGIVAPAPEQGVQGQPVDVTAAVTQNGDGSSVVVEQAGGATAYRYQAPAGEAAPAVTPPATPVVDTPAPAPAVVEPTPVAAPAPVPAVPAVDPAVAEEMRKKISTLETRLADMERELNDLRKQQAQAQPAAAASTSEVSAADFKALERRIDALATKAASAPVAPKPVPAPKSEPRVPAAAAVPTAAPTPVITSQPASNPTMAAPATSTVRTAVGAATREGAAPAAPRTPVATSPAAPTTLTPAVPTASGNASAWQLRSAQPGRAWLAQQGSQEMRSVGVGDEVKGLGRILSIAQGSDGRWVVRGSMGSVSQ